MRRVSLATLQLAITGAGAWRHRIDMVGNVISRRRLARRVALSAPPALLDEVLTSLAETALAGPDLLRAD